MKSLRLSRSNKWIAGVCGGFANYLGLDAALIRVVWLCLAVFGGTGFLAYVICWIVIPKED